MIIDLQLFHKPQSMRSNLTKLLIYQEFKSASHIVLSGLFARNYLQISVELSILVYRIILWRGSVRIYSFNPFYLFSEFSQINRIMFV
jgi:hypothetical protein